MKKALRLLLVIVVAMAISTASQLVDGQQGSMVYASSRSSSVSNSPGFVPQGDTEKIKVEFAYEIAQITAKIVSTPTTDIDGFKAEFAYATTQVTAKVMPMLPSSQRPEFAYRMAQITTKIINDQNLDIRKAKVEYAYEIAQLTTELITNANEVATGKKVTLKVKNDEIVPKEKDIMAGSDESNKKIIRNNDDVGLGSTASMAGSETVQKNGAQSSYIAPETYNSLIEELTQVTNTSQPDNKVKIDGEVRYHYAVNNGRDTLGNNSSGIRARIAFDAKINQNWHAYGMLEGKKNIINYDSDIDLSHLYVIGKLGQSTLQAGSFGYLMAEGNIYDSGFDGIRVDFGKPVKYTASYGQTDNTKKTAVATARYEDYDYNLEAGVYHYQDDASHAQNTIWSLGGNYNFSNFGLGAMALGSRLKDDKDNRNGYVLSVNYGDLKTWRPGTYGIFSKYYNQPQFTYIAHGMNGMSNKMHGFKGYGFGMNYTVAENVVAGLEYYNLRDKSTGEPGKTWWGQVTRYF